MLLSRKLIEISKKNYQKIKMHQQQAFLWKCLTLTISCVSSTNLKTKANLVGVCRPS